jgi:uncharacterized protein (TIGR03437 family)
LRNLLFQHPANGGAHNKGTAFQITPAGAFTVLYNFGSTTSDAANPAGRLIQATDGDFYGATTSGGATGGGTIFKLTTAGALSILHSLAPNLGEGASPAAGVVQASDGNFYGTTVFDGAANSAGTVFKLTPGGVFTTLHSFFTTDGIQPKAPLIQATDGNFYGTTFTGGGPGVNGTVFRITPAGTFTVIHGFSGGADGANPTAGLSQASDGALYGVTGLGGGSGNVGSIFKIALAGAPVNPNAPTIDAGGVVPLYSGTTSISPGEWISIYGSNLAPNNATWTGNFPTTLGGTSVTINGKPAYLWFVSPRQINLQPPDDTATGSVAVVVSTSAGSATATVTLAQFAPSFDVLDATHVAGIIPRSDGSGAYGGGTYDIVGPTGSSLGYPTVAAKAGDVVELFGTGFGPTNPAVAAGQVFSGADPTSTPVTLLINNVSLTPSFAGLSGAGLDQINVTIPTGLGKGDVPVRAIVGGVQTPATVVVSVQ